MCASCCASCGPPNTTSPTLTVIVTREEHIVYHVHVASCQAGLLQYLRLPEPDRVGVQFRDRFPVIQIPGVPRLVRRDAPRQHCVCHGVSLVTACHTHSALHQGNNGPC